MPVLLEAADQRAADEPRQSFDEEVAGVVLRARGGPCAQGDVANQGAALVLEELEARWAVGKVANEFECGAEERLGRGNEFAMLFAAERLDEGEDGAFGLGVLEEAPPRRLCDEANEEADLMRGGAGRAGERVAVEAVAGFTTRDVAAEIRFGEGRDPV